MQERTLQKVARVCNEAVDLEQFVQPIDLDRLQPEQRQGFLATLHSSSVTRSNIVILDESVAVFRGDESEARAFLSMVASEADLLESKYLQKSARTLQFMLRSSRGYGIAIAVKSQQEASEFIEALNSGSCCRNCELLREEIERLRREAHSWSSRNFN